MVSVKFGAMAFPGDSQRGMNCKLDFDPEIISSWADAKEIGVVDGFGDVGCVLACCASRLDRWQKRRQRHGTARFHFRPG
jgi:hypothetical protein